MLKYLFRRFNLLFITGFILTVIAFTVSYWSTYKQTVDSNYVIDYFYYLVDLIRGDWGLSTADQQPILQQGWSAFISTLEMCFIAFIAAIVIAVPLGTCAALNRNRTLDHIIMTIVLFGLALPVFWLSTISSIWLNMFDIALPIDSTLGSMPNALQLSVTVIIDVLIAGETCHLGLLCDRLLQLLLSSAVLSIFLISELTRLTRHSITAVMKSNYIKAAYAKGQSSRQIVLQHVIKNALPPIIDQFRLQLSTIISFAMVIEIVFSTPGIGSWLLDSINTNDYIALPTAILLISGFILLTSIFVDILLVLISPIKRKSLYVD